MNQYTLETERLLLRKFESRDLGDFFEYAKNPLVGPNAGWPAHRSLKDTEEVLARFMVCRDVWAVVWKETGKVIGSVGLHPDQKRSPSAGIRAIGYALSADYWGRGIMTETVKRMIQFSFEEAGLEMLTLFHFSGNERSRRIAEKCGFVREGMLRHCTAGTDRKWQDTCCYSMTAEEYRRSVQISSL